MTTLQRSDKIELTIDPEGIAILRMCDVAGRNAFSRTFVDELVTALGRLDNPQVKVAVLCGLHDVFSAGGDRALLLELSQGGIAPYDLLLTRSLLEVPVPTIAAMRGAAVGGALVFGLTCDMVVMSERARYGANFMELGFTPGMGTTALIQAAFGEYLAAEMMFSARYVSGRELKANARVNAILPPEQVEERALQLAARIADKPRAATLLLKRTLGLGRRMAFEQARLQESLMHEICFADRNLGERIRAEYLPTGSDPAEAPAGQEGTKK